MLTNAQALEVLLAAEPSHVQDEEEYGLLEDERVILVRTYGDDGDDQLLAEVRPRYIVMMEPNMDFVRRIEVSLINIEGMNRESDIKIGLPWFKPRSGGSSVFHDLQQNRRGAQVPRWTKTRKECVRIAHQRERSRHLGHGSIAVFNAILEHGAYARRPSTRTRTKRVRHKNNQLAHCWWWNSRSQFGTP